MKTYSQKEYARMSAAQKIDALHWFLEANSNLVDDLPNSIPALMTFHEVVMSYDVESVADVLEVIADPKLVSDSPRKWRAFIRKYRLDWERGETPEERKCNRGDE